MLGKLFWGLFVAALAAAIYGAVLTGDVYLDIYRVQRFAREAALKADSPDKRELAVAQMVRRINSEVELDDSLRERDVSYRVRDRKAEVSFLYVRTVVFLPDNEWVGAVRHTFREKIHEVRSLD